MKTSMEAASRRARRGMGAAGAARTIDDAGCPGQRGSAYGRGDERAAPVNGDDHAAIAQDLHRMPDGCVGNSIFLGKRAFAGELDGELASLDPSGDVVGDLKVAVVARIRVHRPGRHAENIDAFQAAKTSA